MQHLARLNEVLDGAQRDFEVGLLVEAMQVVEVDAVGLEATQ